MAMSDYMPCEQCDGKAYYDAGIEYDDAAVYALCGECSNKYRMVIETKGDSDA